MTLDIRVKVPGLFHLLRTSNSTVRVADAAWQKGRTLIDVEALVLVTVTATARENPLAVRCMATTYK
jgi:hypothetical protein